MGELTDKVKGSVKETVGEAKQNSRDPETRAEGRAQKIDGKTYLITIDGDFQMVYYRKDVLDELGLQPPKTWDEYLEVAAAANGKDMNGDGQADFGSCMFKKRNAQSFYAIMSIAAPFVQTQGTGQGIFFNTEDMTPMVNNAAWARAFEIYKETGKYGPPEEMNQDIGDTRALVTSGRCALVIDWGDITAGDVATDLAGIWGLFEAKAARDAAIARYAPTEAELARARAWAVLFGAVLLDTGLADHPAHAAMGAAILRRIDADGA